MPTQLPNSSPSWVYEGLNENQFEDATGIVVNRAPKQIHANVQYLATVVDALQVDNDKLFNALEVLHNAPAYSASSIYSVYDVVQDANGCVWVSIADNNVGKALTNTSYWKPVSINIKDTLTQPNTTWSSTKITSYIASLNLNPSTMSFDGGNANG